MSAKHPPIVFITSNDEKELPDAFLRRCLFYYIKFPSEQQLKDIVNAHFPSSSQSVVQAAVQRFQALRQQMEDEKKGRAGKKVSTSELLDWFAILREHAEDEALSKLQGQLPYAEVLLKSWHDHVRYLEMQTEVRDES